MKIEYGNHLKSCGMQTHSNQLHLDVEFYKFKWKQQIYFIEKMELTFIVCSLSCLNTSLWNLFLNTPVGSAGSISSISFDFYHTIIGSVNVVYKSCKLVSIAL